MRIGTREAVRRIAVALARREAFSLVRLGDGECRAIRALKAGRMPPGWIESDDAGEPSPERAAVYLGMVADGLSSADLLSLPYVAGAETYLEPLASELAAFMDVEARDFCDTAVATFLVVGGYLWGLLAGHRILIMNDNPGAIADAVANETYSEQWRTYGAEKWPPWNIVGVVRTDGESQPGHEQYGGVVPLSEWQEPEAYVEQAAAYDFDVALVGFGWRSTIVCPMLAARTGKVVLDMGQVLREVWLKREKWWDWSSWGRFQEAAEAAL